MPRRSSRGARTPQRGMIDRPRSSPRPPVPRPSASSALSFVPGGLHSTTGPCDATPGMWRAGRGEAEERRATVRWILWAVSARERARRAELLGVYLREAVMGASVSDVGSPPVRMAEWADTRAWGDGARKGWGARAPSDRSCGPSKIDLTSGGSGAPPAGRRRLTWCRRILESPDRFPGILRQKRTRHS